MPTPQRTQGVEQINFGLSQGRSSINAIASLLSSSFPYVSRSLLFSLRSIDQHIAREKELAIIVIYVFITNHSGTACLHCFQLLAYNIRPNASLFSILDRKHYCTILIILQIAVATITTILYSLSDLNFFNFVKFL